jgi:AAA domain
VAAASAVDQPPAPLPEAPERSGTISDMATRPFRNGLVSVNWPGGIVRRTARTSACWTIRPCWWWTRRGCSAPAKLARLLNYAQDAGAKIVLVGDDQQLASIEADGGFRGLRLRLGASQLTENRRQAEPWERQAVERLRDGEIELALDAYRAHDRLVATETAGQLKQTMLADWWRSFQQGRRVAILAYRRDEVDQFNTACQQLRDTAGQLGAERLQVGDRAFAVGDQVVCGKNALQSLGVANASRGQVVALDVEQRSMTLKLEDGRQVRCPASTWTGGRRAGLAATPTGAPSIWPTPRPGTSRRAEPGMTCWSG